MGQPITVLCCFRELQEAKDSLDLLAVHSRQLKRWQEDTITDAERAEVERLQSIIPETCSCLAPFELNLP